MIHLIPIAIGVGIASLVGLGIARRKQISDALRRGELCAACTGGGRIFSHMDRIHNGGLHFVEQPIYRTCDACGGTGRPRQIRKGKKRRSE